jgi:hypothetical protein
MRLIKLISVLLFAITIVSIQIIASATYNNINLPNYVAQVNVCDPNYFGGVSGIVCEGRNTKTTDVKTQVKAIVESINKFLFGVAPAITVVAIIVGAYMIMEKGLIVGIAIIQWALIGLVVVLLSSGILSTILRVLL